MEKLWTSSISSKKNSIAISQTFDYTLLAYECTAGYLAIIYFDDMGNELKIIKISKLDSKSVSATSFNDKSTLLCAYLTKAQSIAIIKSNDGTIIYHVNLRHLKLSLVTSICIHKTGFVVVSKNKFTCIVRLPQFEKVYQNSIKSKRRKAKKMAQTYWRVRFFIQDCSKS